MFQPLSFSCSSLENLHWFIRLRFFELIRAELDSNGDSSQQVCMNICSKVDRFLLRIQNEQITTTEPNLNTDKPNKSVQLNCYLMRRFKLGDQHPAQACLYWVKSLGKYSRSTPIESTLSRQLCLSCCLVATIIHPKLTMIELRFNWVIHSHSNDLYRRWAANTFSALWNSSNSH